jgi:putative toxin-antitoxin system antitoxin component (TIGR02293 family)
VKAKPAPLYRAPTPISKAEVAAKAHFRAKQGGADVVGHARTGVIERVFVSRLEDVLGARDKMQGYQIVQTGIPARLVADATTRFGVPKERFVIVLGVSKPTLNRLAKEDKALDTVASDVFKDASQVLEKVREAMGGNKDLMNQWLNSFVPALGCKPIELLGTKDGRELVGATIDRATYGVFA